MNIRLAALTIATVALVGVAQGDAKEARLRLDVSPRITHAPGAFRIRATVPRQASNRTLHVIADSGEYYRSSLIPLDGENAAMITELFLENLPRGAYQVSVVLTDAEGKETVESRLVAVGMMPY